MPPFFGYALPLSISSEKGKNPIIFMLNNGVLEYWVFLYCQDLRNSVSTDSFRSVITDNLIFHPLVSVLSKIALGGTELQASLTTS